MRNLGSSAGNSASLDEIRAQRGTLLPLMRSGREFKSRNTFLSRAIFAFFFLFGAMCGFSTEFLALYRA